MGLTRRGLWVGLGRAVDALPPRLFALALLIGALAGMVALWGLSDRLEQALLRQAGQQQAETLQGLAAQLARVPGPTAPSLWPEADAADPVIATALFHAADARLLQSVAGGRAIEPDEVPALAALVGRYRERAAPSPFLSEVDATRIRTAVGVPGRPWVLVRAQAATGVLAPWRALRQQAGAWALGLALLVLLCGGLLMWRRQRTLGRLLRRMRQVLTHTLPAGRAWPVAPGLLGELADTLRQVAVAQEGEQQRLRQMVGQLEAILEHASVGIVVTRHRTLELMGHRASAMLGYAPGELHGQPARVLYPSEQAYEALGRQVREQFTAHGSFDGELQFRRRDGQDFWVHMLGRGVVPGDPEGGTIWIFDDITAEREARRALSWRASHDSLTGLVNRRELEQRLQQQLQPGRAAGEAGGCLLFVDLDHFKAVNDDAGHAAGDQVLSQVARMMEALVRQSDTVGRLGGDEFALLLPGCTLERARQIAEAVRGRIEAWPITLGPRVHVIGCSIGLVQLGSQYRDVAAVLHAADMACYRAKRAGRNQVAVVPAAAPAPALPQLASAPPPP